MFTNFLASESLRIVKKKDTGFKTCYNRTILVGGVEYMSLLQWIIIVSTLALALNFGRFFLSQRSNRLLVFIFFSCSFLLFQGYQTDEYWLLIALYLFAGMYTLDLPGLFIAISLIFIQHLIYMPMSLIFLNYLILSAVLIYFAGKRANTYFNQLREWKKKMYHNTKQLTILKEISSAIQQTDELNRLLHIIVTTITAGHGLGFNRCLVFLTDGQTNHMQGMMGIGPVRGEDGFDKWNDIAEKKYKLTDLLERMDEEHIDPELNDLVSSLTFKLDPNTLFHQALTDGRDRLVRVRETTDPILHELSDYFHMHELLIVPMVYQNEKIGILIIDNPVTHKKITPEEIDNLIPLALQTAISIHQLALYKNIKEMSETDGLTKLKNQRSLKEDLKRIFSEKSPRFGMVMIDIDFFKHYNDTNGHLLGNVALEQLAKLLKSHLRNIDQSYRFGGEEFVLILMNVTVREAYAMAEDIRKLVEQTAFPNEQAQPTNKLTISVGVSHTELINQLTEEHVLNTSDEALYKAKTTGKNRVVLYDKEMIM